MAAKGAAAVAASGSKAVKGGRTVGTPVPAPTTMPPMTGRVTPGGVVAVTASGRVVTAPPANAVVPSVSRSAGVASKADDDADKVRCLAWLLVHLPVLVQLLALMCIEFILFDNDNVMSPGCAPSTDDVHQVVREREGGLSDAVQAPWSRLEAHRGLHPHQNRHTSPKLLPEQQVRAAHPRRRRQQLIPCVVVM